jgi:hypothetical protein
MFAAALINPFLIADCGLPIYRDLWHRGKSAIANL